MSVHGERTTCDPHSETHEEERIEREGKEAPCWYEAGFERPNSEDDGYSSAQHEKHGQDQAQTRLSVQCELHVMDPSLVPSAPDDSCSGEHEDRHTHHWEQGILHSFRLRARWSRCVSVADRLLRRMVDIGLPRLAPAVRWS